MTDEQKANTARELLRGGLLTEAFKDIKSSISTAWTVAEESEERDKLWYLQKSIDMFEDVIEGYVSNYEYQQKVK